MNVILSYLDNMFMNLPKTAEVQRAKEELASMMEDKYNELLAEGKKENEAVGIVISEFGDLGELAEELGLSGLQGASAETTTARRVDSAEAEAYMETSKKTAGWIAFGVFLCICCPIPLIICGGLEELLAISDAQVVCFGLIPLFLMIGFAVTIFIFNGMKLERFEYLKKEETQIDSYLEKKLRQMNEEERLPATIKTIIGVMLCIFAVIPVLVVGSVSINEFYQSLSVVALLVIIAIAVVIFIVGGNKRECIRVLLQEGDFTRSNKKGNKIVGIIGSVYWPIATVIYLCWSFLTMEWWITWIVWPVAGVIFGGIAAVCNAISGVKDEKF